MRPSVNKCLMLILMFKGRKLNEFAGNTFDITEFITYSRISQVVRKFKLYKIENKVLL